MCATAFAALILSTGFVFGDDMFRIDCVCCIISLINLRFFMKERACDKIDGIIQVNLYLIAFAMLLVPLGTTLYIEMVMSRGVRSEHDIELDLRSLGVQTLYSRFQKYAEISTKLDQSTPPEILDAFGVWLAMSYPKRRIIRSLKWYINYRTYRTHKQIKDDEGTRIVSGKMLTFFS